MNSHRIIKILSLAILISMAVSFVACNKLPPEPVPGSDITQGSTAPASTDHTVSDTEEKTDTVPDTEEKTDTVPDTEKKSDTDTAKDSSPTKEKSSDTSAKNTQTPSDSAGAASQTSDLTDTANPRTESSKISEPPVYNTNITPIPTSQYYGKTWLATQSNAVNLLKTYEVLAAGVEAMKETIPIRTGLSYEDLVTVWECYRADYPQHFWVKVSFRWHRTGNKITSVSPNYTMTAAEKEEAQPKFHAAVQELLADIDGSLSQYEIEKIIHDRLILHCKYEDGDHAHDAYGALVEGIAVCEGFARAFQYLCRSVGIQSLYVQGIASDQEEDRTLWEGHAWNAVLIDGEYYHVDATWDDREYPEDLINYAWFNVTTEQIWEDHETRQLGYPIPECTATEANYFVCNDIVLQALSLENVLQLSEKRADGYFFRAYLTEQTDAKTWFRENVKSLAQDYGLNGYSYVLYTSGREVVFIMTNYKG